MTRLLVPARRPRAIAEMRVLVVDAAAPGAAAIRGAPELPALLAPGDVVVLNDAATLPAALSATDAGGQAVEVRLAGPLDGALEADAVLLGAGDHRTPTEDRPAPPYQPVGALLDAGPLGIAIVGVSSLSPRLVRVRLLASGGGRAEETRARVVAAMWSVGRPVQYAHVPTPLALWDVWNAWAAEPWAVEMPSAGRLLDARALSALWARGVTTTTVTHAAGLSSVGDPAVDAALPLSERTRVSGAAVRAVLSARARGGRVLAVGTSVVRALETAARATGPAGPAALTTFDGTTELRMGAGVERRVVDGVLTGVHDPGTSHHDLLSAFVPARLLAAAAEVSAAHGLLSHELGDAWLVWGERRGGDRSGLGTARDGEPVAAPDSL